MGKAALPIMSNQRKHYFYPPGGKYNKLRSKQVFFHNLLEQKAIAYSLTKRDKQEWINDEILSYFPGGFFEMNKNGIFERVNDDYAYNMLGQKLRDKLKAIRKKGTYKEPPPSPPPQPAPAPAAGKESSKCARFSCFVYVDDSFE